MIWLKNIHSAAIFWGGDILKRKYNLHADKWQEGLTSVNNTTLPESDKNYRRLYSNLPLSYHSLDINGVIIEVNEAWLELLGYSRQEVLGEWFGKFLAPELHQQFLLNFSHMKARGKIYGAELTIQRKDGTQIYIMLDGKIGYDAQGNFQQTYCILHDITKTKHLEEELRGYRVHLEELVQERILGLKVSNEQLQHDISERKHAEEVLRKQRGKLQEQLSFASALNRIAEAIISQDDTYNTLQTMTKIIGSTMRVDRAFIYDIDFEKNQGIGLCEWLNRNSPNATPTLGTFSLDYFIEGATYMRRTQHWLESHFDDYNVLASHDGSGNFLHEVLQVKSGLWYPFYFREQGFYCLIFSQVDRRRNWRKEELEFISAVAQLVEIAIQKIRFISEQKQAEEALRLSEERFNMAFKHSPVAMSISSLESGTFIDVNECCLKMHDYLREEFIGSTELELNLWLYMDDRTSFLQDIREKGYAHNYEIKCHKKNGEQFDTLVSGVVINLNGQKCLLVIKVDITELRQYRRELLRLDRLNLIGQMAAGIAHEIRNPLTTVKGFLQLLSGKKEYAKNTSYFTLMIEELDRANSIITEFLSLVKNKPINLKRHNLNQILESLYPLIQADAMVTDIRVELELNPIQDTLMDDKEIRQLIFNLVRNGLEAMSSGGKLSIRTIMKNNKAVLIVQDLGNGIDADAIHKIGTPFFTTKDNGTGLGLATCYSIVARHNAMISFDSSPAGTTFYIRFETM